MYQSFDVKGGPKHGRANLPKLRKALAAAGLDGFIVPHEDEYQNEYLPAANERLAWLTGFTGSAGAAIVLADKAAVFADGRYTLQVRTQADGELFAHEDFTSGALADWIRAHAPAGSRIGYDPKLHSPDSVAPLEKAAAEADAELVAVEANPIDAAWADRPPPPRAQLVPHDLGFAGESHAEKRARLAKELTSKHLDAALITAPASLAWLLNVRGGDVACSPLPLGAAVLKADGQVDLFVAPEKMTDVVRSHLGNAVAVRDETDIAAALAELGGKRVRVDPATTSAWHFDRLKAAGATLDKGMDIVALPKACKNDVEIAGARRAHVRDGAAVTRFLHWLATDAQTGKVDEIEAVVKLEELRRTSPEMRDISFETISGAGPNGAIVHYRVNTKTNRKLKRGSLFLVDSGAQYPDGTTDITRVAPIGRAKPEMKERYTLVLKGHIALATIRFPEGTTGSQLDVLARAALWMRGLDYKHGTGHGVGSYLGVHEGPQRIAPWPNTVALKPGMIVSNEPGYYKTDGYGIRIENLIVVTPAEDIVGGDVPMHGFETLTMAPLERLLIVKKMLTKDERAWVDAYHMAVLERVGPKLDGDVKAWLEAQCAPL